LGKRKSDLETMALFAPVIGIRASKRTPNVTSSWFAH
jgi:hypothetical protein